MEWFQVAIDLTGGSEGAGRTVVDLGSGAGNETLVFLDHGWTVHSVDGEPKAMEILHSRVTPGHKDRHSSQLARFHEANLPSADLVFASLSLPFAGDHHAASVANALGCLRPGGWFVGVFFGHNDTWANHAQVFTVDQDLIATYFQDFEKISIKEEEFDGPSGSGPKHWHWYVVSAARPS